jgi:hypothetical protein
MAGYRSSDNILDTVPVSVFWYVVSGIFGSGMIYILLWSIQPVNNNLPAAIISIIFLLMFLLGIILSKLEILKNGTLAGNSLALWLGVLSWSAVRYLMDVAYQNSGKLFSLTANATFFSTSLQTLPLFLQFIFNVIVAPIAEEMLWIVAIPYIVISIGDYFAKNKKYSFMGNRTVQVLIMVLIATPTFALFHIGNLAITSFLIFVALFRTILLITVYLPSGTRNWAFTILPAFAIGAHITNNFIEFGVTNGLNVMNSSFWYMGLIAFVFIFGTLGIALLSVYNKITKGTFAVGGTF